MPTQPTVANYNVTLERRLEIQCRTAMRLVDGLETADCNIVLRDEDDPLIQNTTTPLPIVKLRATDMGSVKTTPQGSLPIRNVELKLTCRSTKEKADSGDFGIFCADVEEWLDNTNLKTQLTNAATGVYSMFATRKQGTEFNTINNIREQTYTISIKAVPGELTT